jgi:hypothetical protein
VLPAGLALEPALPREIARRFRLMAPLVETLNQAILDGVADAGRPVRRVGANALL